MNPLDAAATTTETWNASALTFLTQLPSWAIALVVIGLAGGALVHLTTTRGAPAQLRATLFALRAVLSLLVLVLVLEPGKKSMQTTREPNRVVIALDVSASMAERETQTRADSARIVTAAKAAQALVHDVRARAQPFVPEVFAFDTTWRRIDDAELAALASGATAPSGNGSRLALPVASIAQSAGDGDVRPLGGAVIVSDGADSSGLTAALTAELKRDLGRIGAPVHTALVGDPARFQDLALVRAVADDFAFVRNKLSVDVVVRHKGYAGQPIALTLREDGRPVATTELVLDGDSGEQKATFTFEPQRAGKRIYTINAPLLPDESIVDNNRVDFALKLIRDRIRVLQVAGRPSWDERFVRRLLKENPSVDLISFFILRSTTDSANAANRELSLIPFPTRELFTEELDTFDVVIFQDFNYAPYNMQPYLQNVKQFVEDSGGGFVMLGGDLSFSEGGYANTPIADILPVRLLPGNGHVNTDEFVPVATDAGRSHPITDLGDVGGADGFAALPPLEGINLTAGLVPGAEALLTHPFVNAEGGPAPVVAVREVGKGRSMAITTDSTWLWSLPHVGAGGRGDAHRRFFANALRWLIRDPELSRTKLVVDVPDAARGVEPGEAVPLEIRTFNPKYQPEAGDQVKLTLEPLDVATGTSGGAPLVFEGTSGDGGAWRTTFTPPAAGVWRARADAMREGKAIGSDEDAFVVRATATERLYLEPRPDLLDAIASAGRGEAVRAADVTGLKFVDHEVERVLRQKTEPLFSSTAAQVLVLIVIAGFAGAEWWWRRRRGFA
jgi:uncharacterized membrane protein